MTVEHKHNYAIALPCWIARFVPNLHLIPQGFAVNEGKNDRLIFNVSLKPEHNSFNRNMPTNTNTAPPIEYGEKVSHTFVKYGTFAYPILMTTYLFGMTTSLALSARAGIILILQLLLPLSYSEHSGFPVVWPLVGTQAHGVTSHK